MAMSDLDILVSLSQPFLGKKLQHSTKRDITCIKCYASQSMHISWNEFLLLREQPVDSDYG